MLKKSMLFALILINFSLAFTGDNPKKRRATDSDVCKAVKQAINDFDAHKKQATLSALINRYSARLSQTGRAVDASDENQGFYPNEDGHLKEISIGKIYKVVTPWQPLWAPRSPIFLP